MRVQVVAEEQADVGVRCGEEAGLAVVGEVALVDRLEPEREPGLRERREHGHELTLVTRAKRLLPQGALVDRP